MDIFRVRVMIVRIASLSQFAESYHLSHSGCHSRNIPMKRIRGLLGQSLWQSPISKRKTKAKRRFDSALRSRIAAQVDVLEERVMLAVTDPRILAVGSDFGSVARVGVYEATTGNVLFPDL